MLGRDADVHRAGHRQRAVERALLLQALASRCCDASHHGPAGAPGPGRERRRAPVGDGWRSRSRSSRTITRRRSSPTRAPRPASAASCATCSPWAPGRSRVLNSLRFGPLDEPRNRYLFAGVVKGIGDYGNCVGVPTLGGEVDFDPGYAGNPLVNAMCVGLLREEELITRARPRRGQPAHRRRRPHRPRRHSRRHLRLGGADRGQRASAGPRCRSAIRSPRSCCSRRASSSSTAGTSSPSRTWVPRDSRARRPRWPRAAASAWRSTPAKVPVREAGHDAVRDPALRIAGAHARRRGAGPRGRRRGGLPRSGSSTPRSIGQRHR